MSILSALGGWEVKIRGKTVHVVSEWPIIKLPRGMGLKVLPSSIEDWDYLYNIMVFFSERQHYVTFHPLGILRYHCSLMFTFLFTFLSTWKVAGDLKFKLKFGFEIEFEFKLEGFWSVFFKCLGSPCYLMNWSSTKVKSVYDVPRINKL